VVASEADGGMQITGSPQSAEFNGFKMTKRERPVFGADIQRCASASSAAISRRGRGKATRASGLDAYRAMLVERVASPRGLTVVMDCGNGCAGTVVPETFERMGIRVVPLYAELDGRFPNHLPDPTVPSLLTVLIAAVKRTRSGPRHRLRRRRRSDRRGRPPRSRDLGDQLLALFARDVLERVPGAEICST
jgi:phosphomannomutase